MFYYVPLESYKERYTMQWSAPEVGWIERKLRRYGHQYVRVDPSHLLPNRPPNIIKGAVLDAVGRSVFAFRQIEMLLSFAEQGTLKTNDVIYFDDFWHPGIEALPYAFSQFNIKPRMYGFLHAQSVDEFDFTYGMRFWMRFFEMGIARSFTKIFVCCPSLADQVAFGNICEHDRIAVTGHPYASDEVMERMPAWYRSAMSSTQKAPPMPKREMNIVYSSRFDNEKNPHFFLDVVREVLLDPEMNEVTFTICTGAPKLRSNDPQVLDRLHSMLSRFSGRLSLREGLTKEEYYAILASSRAQMNTANQDWVAITLLEASTAGCFPIYPFFRSFPETFRYRPEYMYQHLNMRSAIEAIRRVTQMPEAVWSKSAIQDRSWIHDRFDSSFFRMLQHMGYEDGTPTNPYESKPGDVLA